MKILCTDFPSFKEYPLHIPVPQDFITTNASVTMHNGELYAVVNAIDQHVDQHGGFRPNKPGQNPRIAATNLTFLARLAFSSSPVEPGLVVTHSTELSFPEIIDTPWDFRGFESPRLISWEGYMHVIAASHAAHPFAPGAKLFMGRIEADTIVGVRELVPEAPEQFEKNWMPERNGDTLRFYHKPGTIIGLDGVKHVTGGRQEFAHMHGGTQVVPYGPERLAIVHDYVPSEVAPGKQSVQHFMRFAADGSPLAISERIQFTTHCRTEVAIGMAQMGSHMIVSYGRDNAGPYPFQERPFLASFTLDDLGRLPYDDRKRTRAHP